MSKLLNKENLKPVVVLSSICIIVALLLAGVNTITGPIIEAAQNAAANEALLVVLPDGKDFTPIEITSSYPEIVNAGWKADGGYVFRMKVTGKSSGLVIMCGVDSEGKIVGTKVIATQETPEYSAKVFPYVEGIEGKYAGMDLAGFDPYLVSKCTLTSEAYSDAVKAALQSFVIANGGSVDTRNPEQILQDNCNAALGTTDVKFTRWFATEALVGVDKTYVASDKSGYVFVIGESFIGVNADGVVTDGVSEADIATVNTAYALASGSNPTDITLPNGANTELITKASVTASGNYIFELEAEGYDYVFEYSNGNMAGNPQTISIKVSIDPEGKIIDCITVKHAESTGIGDKCATDKYYDSWAGVSAEDVVISRAPISADSTAPGAISGATYTTQGYQKAIKAAFAAFELITEGGAADEQ